MVGTWQAKSISISRDVKTKLKNKSLRIHVHFKMQIILIFIYKQLVVLYLKGNYTGSIYLCMYVWL